MARRIHDREPLYTNAFRELLAECGVEPLRLPARSPNLNAYAERLMRSIKEECLERLVLLGEGHRRVVVRQYVEHYHSERNHQGLDKELLTPLPELRSPNEKLRSRERIGGLLNFYYREAA